MQISVSIGGAATYLMTGEGMGNHFILLSEEQISGYLYVRARTVPTFPGPGPTFLILVAHTRAVLLDRQRELSLLDSLHQAGPSLTIPPHLRARHSRMGYHRGHHHLHRPLGIGVRHHRLGPDRACRRVLEPHEAGHQVRLRLAQRGGLRGDLRSPRGNQHGPRRCCSWCGCAAVFPDWNPEQLLLGLARLVRCWRMVCLLPCGFPFHVFLSVG